MFPSARFLIFISFISLIISSSIAQTSFKPKALVLPSTTTTLPPFSYHQPLPLTTPPQHSLLLLPRHSLLLLPQHSSTTLTAPTIITNNRHHPPPSLLQNLTLNDHHQNANHHRESPSPSFFISSSSHPSLIRSSLFSLSWLFLPHSLSIQSLFLTLSHLNFPLLFDYLFLYSSSYYFIK